MLIFLIGIFFTCTTAFRQISSKINDNYQITEIEKQKNVYEVDVIEKYAKRVAQEQGYENVHYKLNKVIELSENNHIPYKISVDINNDTAEGMFIKKYDYFATYYNVQVGEEKYSFKSEKECNDFIQNVSRYDNQEYKIETTTEMINRETKEEKVNQLIEDKKRTYEEEQERIKIEEEKAKKITEEQAAAASRNSNNNNSPVSYNLSDLQAYAYELVISNYGWTEYDFQCLINLWNKESGWNPNSHNSSTGAHGIPQALPASKMASEGSDYYTNGKTQIRWGLKYILERYGSPSNGWNHFQSKGWY